MRELLRAVARGKHIITLCESEDGKGAMTREEILSGEHGLRAAEERYGQRWGDAYLQAEERQWLEKDLADRRLVDASYAKTSLRINQWLIC